MTQNDLEHYKVMCPINVLLVSMSPIFHSVLLYNQPFSKYKPFWDKCPEWPQIDFESCKVKFPYICITSIPDSQTSLSFTLWPAVFEIQVILRQVHQMTPKWLWTVQGHMCHIYMLLVSTSPKFHSVSLYDEPFSKYRPFWDKCTEWPQNDLEHCIYYFSLCGQYTALMCA